MHVYAMLFLDHMSFKINLANFCNCSMFRNIFFSFVYLAIWSFERNYSKGGHSTI